MMNLLISILFVWLLATGFLVLKYQNKIIKEIFWYTWWIFMVNLIGICSIIYF